MPAAARGSPCAARSSCHRCRSRWCFSSARCSSCAPCATCCRSTRASAATTSSSSTRTHTRLRDPREAGALRREILERVRALPGVSEAAWHGSSPPGALLERERRRRGHRGARQNANFNRVSPGYFATMARRSRRPRLRRAGLAAGEPVAIVTETFARKFLRATNPIGRILQIDAGRRHRPSATGSSASSRTPSTATCARTSRRSSFSRRPRTSIRALDSRSSSVPTFRSGRSCRR